VFATQEMHVVSLEVIETELEDLELKLRNARAAAAAPRASEKDKANLKLIEQEFQAAQTRAQHARDGRHKPARTPTDPQEKLEKKLDKALEQTFPGSDPVAVVEPTPVKKQDRSLPEVAVAEQQRRGRS
jgi:hypothetical protein